MKKEGGWIVVHGALMDGLNFEPANPNNCVIVRKPKTKGPQLTADEFSTYWNGRYSWPGKSYAMAGGREWPRL